MKYQQEIDAAYIALRFKPRDDQVQTINNILTEFWDLKRTNVVLNADTGSGKSIIAAVVAEALRFKNQADLAAIYMSSTNALVNQYADSFESLGDNRFFRIKGSSNYGCQYFMSKGNSLATGEDCVKNDLEESEIAKNCNSCEFVRAKKLINGTQNLITNYAYFVTSKLASGHLKPRDLQVFDEAHLLNEVFCDQVGINISVSVIDRHITDIKNNLGDLAVKQSVMLSSIRSSITVGEITEQNYLEQLEIIERTYKGISTICVNQASLTLDVTAKAKFQKMSTVYSRHSGKIKDFFKYGYEHVFDSSVSGTISIKPLFVGQMIEHLLGKYNLFMSATLSRGFVETTLHLSPETTGYVDAPSTFPAENRPLLFLGRQSLNYAAMQDPATINGLRDMIAHIVDHHKGQRGIILTPSFNLTKQLATRIPSHTKTFEHTSGTNAFTVMQDFKKYKGSAVLLSPSIFEGLDFEGDYSQYQIIVKTPYASMGDKRIARIAREYGSIYKEQTLYKILQGIGRSIRSRTDSAVTYFLDAGSETLYNGKLNLWKSRYTIKSS